jgi:hypothetical protein
MSIGWLYATNSTGGDETLWNANYSNMSTGWLYALNNSLWSSNYSNMSIGWLYATNSTGSGDTFAGNYSNFTTIYGVQIGNASNMTTLYANQLTNWTNSTPYAYALNASLWTLNYSTYLQIDEYALNASLWTLNYSDYLTKPTWAQATNGTILAKLNALNSFGAFNQSFDTSNFFLYATADRVGILTSSPQNTLNVLGDINSTGTIYAQTTKNLSLGYDYATNSSSWISNISYAYALNASLWTLNYTNFSNIYTNVTLYNGSEVKWNANYSNMSTGWLYALNDSRWSANYSDYLTKPTWAQATNGTKLAVLSSINTWTANQTIGNNYLTNGTGGAYIYHNGTGWCIGGC